MQSEIARYIVNGAVATIVHYSILTINIEVIEISSAGLANFIAAIFGVIVSFIGSRYYVYQNHTGTIGSQASKFFLLYAMIALLHGLVLYVWTDVYGLNYRFGFLVATAFQVSLSYAGNKILVFKA